MTTRHDPRLVNLIAGFLAREFGEDGFLPLSKRDGAAVRLLDLLADHDAHRRWLDAQADKPGGLIEQAPQDGGTA